MTRRRDIENYRMYSRYANHEIDIEWTDEAINDLAKFYVFSAQMNKGALLRGCRERMSVEEMNKLSDAIDAYDNVAPYI